MWKKLFVIVVAAVTVTGCGPDQSSPAVAPTTPVVLTSAPVPPTPSDPPPTSAPPVQTLATSAPAAAPTTAPQPATVPQQATQNDTSGTSTSGGGTGSCGEDYYRNSDGVCVHRPASGPGAPSGATAKCKDGTLSYSTHRQGTCSHHGGVAVWY
jgi:hypothetical protein